MWNFPPSVWVKINFDGAAKGNPGQVGCGGVIRDENGRCIVAVELPMGTQTNHLSEAMGTFQTLQIANQLRCRKVWIEEDSNNIIQFLKGKSSTSWKIKNIINASKNLINTFKEFYITHNYRERNSVANYFANIGVRINTRKVWFNEDTLNFKVRSLYMHDQTHDKYEEIPTMFYDESY